MAPAAVLHYQVCLTELTQMLGNGWTGDGKRARDFTGGLAALPEEVEHGPPSGIGESVKSRLR